MGIFSQTPDKGRQGRTKAVTENLQSVRHKSSETSLSRSQRESLSSIAQQLKLEKENEKEKEKDKRKKQLERGGYR